jgi:hypothetical protein
VAEALGLPVRNGRAVKIKPPRKAAVLPCGVSLAKVGLLRNPDNSYTFARLML